MVWSASHIQRTKSQAACFSSGGADCMSTNIVPPVGTLARHVARQRRGDDGEARVVLEVPDVRRAAPHHGDAPLQEALVGRLPRLVIAARRRAHHLLVSHEALPEAQRASRPPRRRGDTRPSGSTRRPPACPTIATQYHHEMGTSYPQRTSPAASRRVSACAVSTSSSQVRGGTTCASSSMRALAKAIGVDRLKGIATRGCAAAAREGAALGERRDEGDRVRALVAVERLEHAGAREVRGRSRRPRATAWARRRPRARCAAWRGTRSSRPGGRPRRRRATGSRCSGRRARAAPCGRDPRTRTRT